MKLKHFNDYKVVNIKGQVVTKKSPWPKILWAGAITAIIIIIFINVSPNFKGAPVFFDHLKNFFDFSPVKQGIRDITIAKTFTHALSLLWTTILFSILGTFIGIITAIPIALLSSKNIIKKWYVYTPFRFLMSFIRSIPPLIIAFLMFNVFSKTLSATMSISIFITAIMTKWLYEELDTIDLSAYKSLQSLGNQKNRSIVSAVFPYFIKSIISYGVYAFEMVIRFAAILGVVGITTIGSLLSDTYKAPSKWGHMLIVILILIVTIIIIEISSMSFKKYVLDRKQKQLTINNKFKDFHRINQVQLQKPKTWIVKACLTVVFLTMIILAIANVKWALVPPIKLGLFKQGMVDLFHPKWSLITEFGTGINALETGLEALLVASAGVIIGLIFSIIFGLLGSKAITGRYFSWVFRIIIISIRSVPAFVYAMMFVFLSPPPNLIFAGALALGIHSIGMLGKLTYEKIDSIDLESRNALEVMGSARIYSTRWALLAEAIPALLSNALYRLEINFKSVVEIGAVGASAFGFQISTYAGDPTRFSDLSAYLIVTIAIVLIIEQASNALRNKLTTGRFISKNNFVYKRYLAFERKRSLINSLSYNLPFSTNSNSVKFNNHVGLRMRIGSAENKEIFKVKSQLIKDEISSMRNSNNKMNKLTSYNKLFEKYSA